MSEACKYTETTKYGELLIVDGARDYEISEVYCGKLSAKLPALNSTSMIQDIWSYLVPCKDIDEDSKSVVSSRDNVWWRIGLTKRNGKWKWSDGQLYEESKHSRLFAMWEIGALIRCLQTLNSKILGCFLSNKL